MRNQTAVSNLIAVISAFPTARAGIADVAQSVQRLSLLVMAAALIVAGPFAIGSLFVGHPMGFAVWAGLSCGTAVCTALGRRRPQIAFWGLQVLLALASFSLSSAMPGWVDAGTLIALAALASGLVGAPAARDRLAVALPLVAVLAAVALKTEAGVVPLALTAIAAVAAFALAGFSLAIRLRKLNDDATADMTSEAVENLAGTIVRFDTTGRPAHISKSIGALLGARAFELTGDGLFQRIHILDRPLFAKSISDLLSAPDTAVLQLRIRRDGEHSGIAGYRWIELSLATLVDETDGRVSGLVGLMRDIGARKAVEDDLKRARAEAEEASEAKTRFLATIGHELRTPLNAIVGFSDMMVEGIGGDLSGTHQEYASHIRQSGHHLLEVVNMLLDMSRIEAGKFELQSESFAPQILIDPCLQMVEKLGRDKSVSVISKLPDQLPAIVGDERACRQIMLNLLSNAIKFSHAGGQVTLSMKRQGKMLAISVSDNGIGMTPETVRRIGEPFLQAQNGLSRRYEGTGLGLSIVKGLVALHGGKLSVASEPGMGTKVTVLLPLDGPSSRASHTATIEHLHERRRDTDEQKWQEDERRSATS